MFTQRLSMDCTQEQYEKFLKDELLKMGYKENYITSFLGCPIIVNNVEACNGEVSNVRLNSVNWNDRTYLGTFNAPLFLALAAMTDKPEGGYREQYITTRPFFRISTAFKEGEFVENIPYTGYQEVMQFCRKATVSEIMEKFGEKKDKSPEDIMKDMSAAIDKMMENISKDTLLTAFKDNLAKLEQIVAQFQTKDEPKSQAIRGHSEMFRVGVILANQQTQKPKFKKGDWLRANDGFIFQVEQVDFAHNNPYYKDNFGNPRFEHHVKKYSPKKGEYYYARSRKDICIGICDCGRFITSNLSSFMANANECYFEGGYDMMDEQIGIIRPATPSEIALLDSKLAEKGMRFDKDRCELVDIHKQPIIGELAIFFDNGREADAIIGKYIHANSSGYVFSKITNRDGSISEYSCDNAILFESIDQYKQFIAAK